MTEHAGESGGHATGDHVGHHVPFWILVATLLVLLGLTAITVAATWVDFGPSINLWIALIIATIKGTLVALIFMHLAYDKPFNAIILVSSLAFVALFIGLAMMDSAAYKKNVDEYRAEDPARYAPKLEGPQSAP
jgi:cytochrome c oxidase subunit 4